MYIIVYRGQTSSFSWPSVTFLGEARLFLKRRQVQQQKMAGIRSDKICWVNYEVGSRNIQVSERWGCGKRFQVGNCPSIHPASRGVAAHTAGLFRSVRGAKGGVEYEEQSSTGFPS